ncbi:hypothetical protein SAMN04487934_11215 [Eubacterium ruminantium]|nr:hypothetical protein SAMN04487934_11215 [Eubacterium ruminantium]
MAIRKRCIYCNAPLRSNGYCTECRMPDEFLRKAANTSLYHYNLALDKARMRDLSGAIDSLKTSLRYDKRNIQARSLLGLIYYEIGEIVEALNHWVMSVNYQPKDNISASYLKELKEDRKALENANDVARMFNLALDYARDRSFDLAVIQLRKCISLNKHFIKGYLLLGLIENEQGRMGRAKKTISRVLAIDKNNPLAIHFLREMGESEGDIVRDIDAAADEDFLEEDYYGIETETGDGKRPARKIEVPEHRTRKENTLSGRYRRISRAKLSNIYVFVGILIGIGILYLLIVPVNNKNNKKDIAKIEANYSERLASKNAEVNNLSKENDTLQKTIDEYKSREIDKDEKIAGMEEEISKLQQTIDENNLKRPGKEDATATDAGKNDTRDGTTNGISDSDIQDMINNE